MRYRRTNIAGAAYFFTVALANRRRALLIERIDLLREVVSEVKKRHPFEITAMVILPDHIHAIWQMPPDDSDYPMRWSLIKAGFSRGVPKQEHVCASRLIKRERGIWQRRYWEHQIRDEQDLAAHVDYIHHNPVKHGYVMRASDWPYSSIHRFIRMGWMSEDWGFVGDEGGVFGE